MRSLFVRIFLWLWLAMAVVAALLVITSPFFTKSRPALESWHESAETWASGRAEAAARQIAEGGVDGLRMGRGQGRGGPGGPHPPARVFVLDEDGVDLHGAPVPPEVVDVARQAASTKVEQTHREGAFYLVARPVVDPDGRLLVVVAAHHSPPRLVNLLEPKALAWRLAVLVVVVGGLSFWLARYLSSPMGALRRATRRLSEGDLSTRVGGRVVRRRDEIGQLARDFDAMAERIEALVGSQRRLLGDVSHELRSPLARLVVALELARARAGDAAGELLDRIGQEADRLDRLIGQLLLLERLESGGAEGEATPVDLGRLLSEVADDAAFEAAAEGREVRFDAPEGVVVDGRAELLRSAFENVLRNAVRHTPSGTAVEVELGISDDEVEVAVRDHGPGIAEDELDRVFEPFYRVQEARERATGGVGLGLAIAARAVRAHGGAVSAANHPEGGLVVTVRLPKR